jgi:hypothetical protein
MKTVTIDAYVVDVLLPDLAGHDRKPSAFLVYLYLLRRSRSRNGRREVRESLQTIATRTGLSKSCVQNALRHLRRRGLLDADAVATTSDFTRYLVDPRAR